MPAASAEEGGVSTAERGPVSNGGSDGAEAPDRARGRVEEGGGGAANEKKSLVLTRLLPEKPISRKSSRGLSVYPETDDAPPGGILIGRLWGSGPTRPPPQNFRGKTPPPQPNAVNKVSPGSWMGVFRGGAAMGSGLILPGTLALMMALLGPSTVHGRGGRMEPPPAAHFLAQDKHECRFADGTRGEVRFMYRYIYGREEIARFDSRRGEYEALTPLGEPDARYWNSQKELLDYMRAGVERFCRYNYGVEESDGITLTRKDQPTVKITHTKAGPLAHHSLLLCTATGYYPSGVRFKWLKNGQEQTEGVGYADEVQNGDWTFLNQAMLETVPQRGDLYACQVEHSSLKEPIIVQWEPRSSNSAQSKVWTGAVGAVLGVVFGAAGVSFYLKTRRAAPTVPAAGLIS
ncbi:PREDICTED: H-2 class II histocompatibility antigen, E-S beta chain-like [Gekko japonicus]|uniref:H-2 class II histocompatibility antigen, E-S beta chain-like n=1 Tax=Gekko japonicus TaxID=146911 RepID=A0ABM1JP89_GEKJA|nr:PREDICTED: H-2 class II histocompatibility antigen, E-S beta chain-like [Gekko japonicus]